MRCLASLPILLALSAFSSIARAADPPGAPAGDAVHFSYDVDDGCPSKSDFTALLRSRGAAFSEDDATARTLDVAMHEDPDAAHRWTGSMRVSDGDDSTAATRTTAATSCSELARSLAIFTSLALTPTAPPPKTLAVHHVADPVDEPPAPPPRDLLHRGRFSLDPHFVDFHGSGDDPSFAGGGLTARYFPSERWALRLDADVLGTTGGSSGSAISSSGVALALPANDVRARTMLSGEFAIVRAKSSIADGYAFFDPVFDVTLDLGAGAMWTRPSNVIDPAYRSFGFSPRPALLQAMVGERIFVTRWLAVSFEEGLLVWDDRSESGSVASTTEGRADDSTWWGQWSPRIGIGGQIGIEFLFPGAAPPPKKTPDFTAD